MYEKSKDLADAVVSEIKAVGRFAMAIQVDSALTVDGGANA